MDFADTNGGNYVQWLQEKAAAGDQSAFRKIFLLYFDRLNRFAFTIVKSDDGAVEIVDEVFVKLWRQRESMPSIHNLRIYLFAATKNTALNYLTRQSARPATEPFDCEHTPRLSGPSPEQLLIMAEIIEKMNEAVEMLPPRCKIIFKMVREEGLRYREVADILNISVNTVDAQMVIAVNRIRESVKEYIDFSARPGLRKKMLLLLGLLAFATVFYR